MPDFGILLLRSTGDPLVFVPWPNNEAQYTERKKALIPERVEELCGRVGHGERKAALAREFGISR